MGVKEDIIKYRTEGLSLAEIASKVNKCKATVFYHLKDTSLLEYKSKNSTYHAPLNVKHTCKNCSSIFYTTKFAKGEYCSNCVNTHKHYSNSINLEELKNKLLNNEYNNTVLHSGMIRKIKNILNNMYPRCAICGSSNT